MYAIYVGNRDICCDSDLDYFTDKEEAEYIARELTKSYSERDTIGHPWYDCKFHVEEVSDEYIEGRFQNWVNQQVAAEMGW